MRHVTDMHEIMKSYTHTSYMRHTCIIKCDTHASDDPLHAQHKIMCFGGARWTKKNSFVHDGSKRMRRRGALVSERQSAHAFTDRTPLQIGRLYRSDAFTDRTSLQIGRLYFTSSQIGRFYRSDAFTDRTPSCAFKFLRFPISVRGLKTTSL